MKIIHGEGTLGNTKWPLLWIHLNTPVLRAKLILWEPCILNWLVCGGLDPIVRAFCCSVASSQVGRKIFLRDEMKTPSLFSLRERDWTKVSCFLNICLTGMQLLNVGGTRHFKIYVMQSSHLMHSSAPCCLHNRSATQPQDAGSKTALKNCVKGQHQFFVCLVFLLFIFKESIYVLYDS